MSWRRLGGAGLDGVVVPDDTGLDGVVSTSVPGGTSFDGVVFSCVPGGEVVYGSGNIYIQSATV